MKGKLEEAKQVLCYAAGVNKKTIPLSLLDKVRDLWPGICSCGQVIERLEETCPELWGRGEYGRGSSDILVY